MTQRDRIYAALMASDKSVRQLMEVTAVRHPGTVRRELMTLKRQGRAFRTSEGTWSVWFVHNPATMAPASLVDAVTSNPIPMISAPAPVDA